MRWWPAGRCGGFRILERSQFMQPLRLSRRRSMQCDNDVFQNGIPVFLTHTIPAAQIEEFIKAVAAEAKQKVDWHYFGGRARVLTLGDPKVTIAALLKLRPMHDKFM